VSLPAGSAPTFVKMSSFVTGGLSIGVTVSRPTYQANDTAVLMLVAFRDGSPVAGATATASVSVAESSSTPTVVALLDDGREPDAAAGDGVYTGGVSDLAPGHYLVTASARVGDYQATGGTNFDVTESLARLAGTKTDAGVDTNGDGLFEWIRVDIGVTVEMAATYEVLASLGTPAGTNELTAAAEAALGPGEQSVELRFLAAEIRRALGTDGPWEVREVILVPVSPNGVSRGVSLDRVPTLGFTRAYSLMQLQRPVTQVLAGLTERAVDTNANGLFDILQTTFTIDTLRAGSYTWTGSLRTLDGTSIGVSSGQGTLPAGVTTVGLAFNGKAIGASGLDGPYRLADVAVYGPAGAAGLQTEVGNTQRYSASQFEGSRITFDRLLELVDALPIFGRGGVPFTQGILNSLRQKVSTAKDQAASGQNQSATGMLGAFINELEALPLERVTQADKLRLIDFARRLQDTLR